jgi:hypothetical protein
MSGSQGVQGPSGDRSVWGMQATLPAGCYARDGARVNVRAARGNEPSEVTPDLTASAKATASPP